MSRLGSDVFGTRIRRVLAGRPESCDFDNGREGGGGGVLGRFVRRAISSLSFGPGIVLAMGEEASMDARGREARSGVCQRWNTSDGALALSGEKDGTCKEEKRNGLKWVSREKRRLGCNGRRRTY